jgi:photosystem II stability/assembly factor-like uncharacterized protein
MWRLLVVLYFIALYPAASQTGESTCLIEGASAAGQSVWLVCEDGKVLFRPGSKDGWKTLALPTQATPRDIAFLDANRGFVIGDRGMLLATEDGGKNWRPAAVPVQENLTAVFFRGELGWVAGWGGTILHTADGGRTWERQATGLSNGLEGIYFLDASLGWAVGWVGTILRTTDGGKTWRQVNSPDANWSLSAVYFRDAENGWVVGFGGQILRSRDGGLTWQLQASPVTSWLTSVLFDEAGRGWITTVDGFLVTEDGGESWRHMPVGNWLFLSGLLRVDGSLWAVGARGVLKETGDGFALDRIENLLASAG